MAWYSQTHKTRLENMCSHIEDLGTQWVGDHQDSAFGKREKALWLPCTTAFKPAGRLLCYGPVLYHVL